MKTILFFDRCELTDLYAPLSKVMNNSFRIIHVAYSNYEANILKNKYSIQPDFIFKNILKSILISETLNAKLIEEIDALIINKTEGRFNLNSSIQSDRGFSLLTYDESLILSQIYYKIWDQIFTSTKIDFFYHEPPSLFFNHIASILCLKYCAVYCYDSMVYAEKKYNYLFLTQDNAHAPELERELVVLTDNDVLKNQERINTFLNNFRDNHTVFLGDSFKINVPYLKLIIESLKFFIKRKYIRPYPHKIADNIDYFLLSRNLSWNKLKNLIAYKFHLKYDNFDSTLDYYYYSMNLEPEATVLYLGDGIYENQIKLIKNIAAQLPVGSYLYVKDHPHFIGYRSINDYFQILNVPNIKLLDPNIPGKQIIRDSKGIIMVNGTAGLEALLFNKHVYTFGNMFFNISDRVNYIHSIRDLREILYLKHKVKLLDDMNLFKFVLAYLNSTHEGVTDFFMGRAVKYDIDLEENTKKIASDFLKFSEEY